MQLLVQAVAHEAQGEAAMFDRPYRAAMVTVGIKRGMIGRQRADSPTGEQIGSHQSLRSGQSMPFFHNAAGQQVPRIGCDGFNGPALGIEPQGVRIFVRQPEFFVEAFF